jgi:guanylate kinase
MVPGSFEELERRLAQRMTESPLELEVRLSVARQELARIHEFDYQVVNCNDCLEQAVADIDSIIAVEKSRVVPRNVQFL